MVASSTPKQIELSLTEKAELIERLKANALSDEDRNLIVGLIEFNHWLQALVID